MPGVDTAVTHVGGSPRRARSTQPAYRSGIPKNVPFAGRRRELQEVGRLLERAAGGAGGLLAITGPPGSGKTALAEAAAAAAGNRGFEVLRADPPEGQPGRLVWAQLLRDVKAPEDLVTRLSGTDASPLDLDAAARHLSSPSPRLILIDDVEIGRASCRERV